MLHNGRPRCVASVTRQEALGEEAQELLNFKTEEELQAAVASQSVHQTQLGGSVPVMMPKSRKVPATVKINETKRLVPTQVRGDIRPRPHAESVRLVSGGVECTHWLGVHGVLSLGLVVASLDVYDINECGEGASWFY